MFGLDNLLTPDIYTVLFKKSRPRKNLGTKLKQRRQPPRQHLPNWSTSQPQPPFIRARGLWSSYIQNWNPPCIKDSTVLHMILAKRPRSDPLSSVKTLRQYPSRFAILFTYCMCLERCQLNDCRLLFWINTICTAIFPGGAGGSARSLENVFFCFVTSNVPVPPSTHVPSYSCLPSISSSRFEQQIIYI